VVVRPDPVVVVGSERSVARKYGKAIVAGSLVGRWLGGWLGLGVAAALAGAGLGVVAAFLNLWRFLRRLERK
jgi:hypothetical protein